MENISKQFLLDKKILLESIKKLSKYYNEDTIKYLIDLLNLKKSVFDDLEFASYFSSLPLFNQIARYNICNRAFYKISRLPIIVKDNLGMTDESNSFILNYKNSFDLLSYVISNEKDCITLYEIISSPEERIEEIERKITKIKNYDYYKMYNNRIKTNLFGTYNAKMFNVNNKKINELKEQIAFLKENANIQMDICNLVTENLLEDWDINFGYEYVKRLPWIDIYKKKV